MKLTRNFAKHIRFTAAAVPIGGALGFLCATVILFVSQVLSWLLYSRPEVLHLALFFEFELKTAAYFGAPEGAVLLPLAYLLFLRHLTLSQAPRTLGWLFLCSAVMGIIGSVAIHSFVSAAAAIGCLTAIFHTLRRTCPDRKQARSRMILGSVALVAVAVIMTPFTWVAGVFWSMHGIKLIEKQLKSPTVYPSVATNLALYCQSVESLKLTGTVGGARLPQPLPQLGHHPWASIYTNYAHVEFGGGFYHYGYRLQLDENASDANTNFWELYSCGEGSPEKLLTRFALSPGARIPIGTFVSNTLSEYSRRIAAGPGNLDAHKGRIRFLLEHDHTQVRQACLDAVKALSEHWWPRLTLALWDSGQGKFAEASKTFVAYVEIKPSYSRYVYLAWFYQTASHPDEAAAAIEKAVQCPVVDLRDDETNTECRGYSVGVAAYQNGKYTTVLKLCDALLPVRENGGYAKAALIALRQAANAGVDGKTVSFQASENILGFNPYEQIDLNALLGR